MSSAGTPALRPGRPGFTLIELAITLAVVALLTSMAVPSFVGLLARQRLEATARQLQADLAYGRQQAMALDRDAFLSVAAGPDWCYALSLGAPVDCRGTAGPAATLLKRVRAESHPDIALIGADPMALQARTGTSRLGPGRAEFVNQRGEHVVLRLGLLGRSTLCVPPPVHSGLPPCPPD